jgi:membrane associated rhomboid family serine protease
VAWFAHVGGFVAGLLLILVLPTRERYRSYS